MVAISALNETEPAGPTHAVFFPLGATDGAVYSLEDALAARDTLLYSSMGVGCDGCFAQIPELEVAMADRGINLLPIMVDPAGLSDGRASGRSGPGSVPSHGSCHG